MKYLYPPEYETFRCLANACPDSCCTDWEIVVDAESEAKYRQFPGILGERLQKSMITDADGDTILQGETRRCPFWNTNQLCDIQSEYGAEALCETCRKFPRLTQDYGDFVELDLSVACPEAAKLLLTKTPEQLVLLESTVSAVTVLPAYDTDVMHQLIQDRDRMFTVLKDTDKPAVVQLAQCLRLMMQKEHASSVVTKTFTHESCLSFLQSCSILSNRWASLVKQALHAYTKFFRIDPQLDHEIRAFAFDFLYRHYLRTISDDMALLHVQTAAFSVLTVIVLCSRLHVTTQKKRLEIWQRFVKEMEYDCDNMEELEFLLCTEAEYSGAALAEALEQLWRVDTP